MGRTTAGRTWAKIAGAQISGVTALRIGALQIEHFADRQGKSGQNPALTRNRWRVLSTPRGISYAREPEYLMVRCDASDNTAEVCRAEPGRRAILPRAGPDASPGKGSKCWHVTTLCAAAPRR